MIDLINKEGDSMNRKGVILSRKDRHNIDAKETIAYWYDMGGIEVKDIQYTPDGIMFYIKAHTMCENPTYHRLKVIEQYTVDGAHADHIKFYNRRLYLKDCLRANIGR